MSVVYKLTPLFAPDAHAVRFLDGKNGKYGYRKVASPLTDADIARHVSRSDPEASLGAYMLRDLHGSKGHVIVFDIDDHDGDTEVETTAVAVRLPLARKSVALRRDGDRFIEIDDPGDVPFCPPLNHIKDPGFPKPSQQSRDPRQAFLSDLLRLIDCGDHFVQTADEISKRWQPVGARLTIETLSDTDGPIGANLITDAESEGKQPVEVLRDRAKNAIKGNRQEIDRVFVQIEQEFGGNGIMAVAIRLIVAAAREAFRLREDDPFFELEFIDQLGERAMSIDDVMRRIPSCAVLQRNTGFDDDLQRDFLLSFLPRDSGGPDPEDGLRVVHSIFNYLYRHRENDELVPTNNAKRGPCPFFTSCNLAVITHPLAIGLKA